MADAADSKSVGSDTVRVQVPPSAPIKTKRALNMFQSSFFIPIDLYYLHYVSLMLIIIKKHGNFRAFYIFVNVKSFKDICKKSTISIVTSNLYKYPSSR